MIAMDRLRPVVLTLVAGSAAVAGLLSSAGAQQAARPAVKTAAPVAATNAPANGQGLKTVMIPVNPTDAVAMVNGESISRQNLADECVARKGKEVLETLIARRLIEQAIREKKLAVTAAEIDAEIDKVANGFSGLGREAWLRSLDKERGISPEQYARDIIYPTLALRKLAAPMVQVTDQDLSDAFDAQFGDKLRCRIIMVDKLRDAQEVWEQLKQNPAGFEKLAQDKSIDVTSRSLGGLLGEPITRHAHPRTVSDAAFQQLVDGDPKDNNPAHKPKDLDFTGPIQVTDASWCIIRRESVVKAEQVDRNNPHVKKMLNEMMYEAKVKSKMTEVYQDLVRASAIENVLTGQTKLANEETQPESNVDSDVKLMSNPQSGNSPAPATRAAAPTSGTSASNKPPVGVSSSTSQGIQQIQNSLKSSKP